MYSNFREETKKNLRGFWHTPKTLNFRPNFGHFLKMMDRGVSQSKFWCRHFSRRFFLTCLDSWIFKIRPLVQKLWHVPSLRVTWPILTPKWGQIQKIFWLSAFWSKRSLQFNFQENQFFCWPPSVPLYRSRCVKAIIYWITKISQNLINGKYKHLILVYPP